MSSYKPTVYEQIVQDFLDNKDFVTRADVYYEKYKDELAERGWAEKRYYDALIEDMLYIRNMMAPGFNHALALQISREYFDDKTAQMICNPQNEDKNKTYFAELKDNLLKKGYPEKKLASFEKDINLVQRLVENPEFNLRLAADIVKKYHPSSDEDVLNFSLTDEEKTIILEAEELGSFKDGEVIEYEGYDKKIVCADYKNLPSDVDAYVIFSGHPGSAGPAIEAWLSDIKKTGKPKKLVFLGLYDNQGNTDFSNQDLQYNTGSEVEMYVRYCRSLGIPEEILQQCLVTPKDTSTKDNTELLAEIRNKYFADKKDVSLAMFGYPAYQKRIASEFAFEFNKMEKDGKVKSTNFVMPVVPVSKDEHDRELSYDKLSGIAQDIILGNCLPHPYRVYAGGRFDSKLGEYPDKFKKYLPISLGYSYPNVANELAGTETDAAIILKLLRAIQLAVYQFENPRVIDASIKRDLIKVAKRLTLEGLITAEDIYHGNQKEAKKVIGNIKKHQKSTNEDINATEAAKILLGSEKVSPRKLGPAAEYLKKFWQEQTQRK